MAARMPHPAYNDHVGHKAQGANPNLNYEQRILRLQTPPEFRHRLPLEVCGRVFSGIPPLVEGALRMAIDGASVIQGRHPAWFQRASDIRLTGYDHQGADTLLILELPKLGEAAEELYKQHEFWDTRPKPELTAFDVLRRVVDEVAIENGESPWFDPQLLRRFTHLRRVFGPEIESIQVKDSGKPTTLDAKVVDTAARVRGVDDAACVILERPLEHQQRAQLVIIEEPELGLHPDALAIIAELLVEAAQRTQVVVTTHSDVLISALTDHADSVLVCEYLKGGTQMHRLESEKLQEWLKEYRLGEIWRIGKLGGNLW